MENAYLVSEAGAPPLTKSWIRTWAFCGSTPEFFLPPQTYILYHTTIPTSFHAHLVILFFNKSRSHQTFWNHLGDTRGAPSNHVPPEPKLFLFNPSTIFDVPESSARIHDVWISCNVQCDNTNVAVTMETSTSVHCLCLVNPILNPGLFLLRSSRGEVYYFSK